MSASFGHQSVARRDRGRRRAARVLAGVTPVLMLVAAGTPVAAAAQTGGVQRAGNRPPSAYVTSCGKTDTLVQVATVQRRVASRTWLGNTCPEAVALSPDGQTAYVSATLPDKVLAVDLSTHKVIGRFLAKGVTSIAVTPDGSTVVASSRWGVVLASTATNTRVGWIPVPGAASFTSQIAIAPDGRTIYEVTTGGVTPIDLATRQVGAEIPISGSIWDIGVTPNGSTVYVTTDDGLVPIPTATRKPGPTIKIPGPASPFKLAISPSGATAYVTGLRGDVPGTVATIDLAARQVVATTTVGVLPQAITVDPAGRTVWVALENSGLRPIDAATHHAEPIVGFDNGGEFSVAVTPDQAPTAMFVANPAPHGQATTFDASTSAAARGEIASYSWDFGDGTRVSSSAPTISHTYQATGSYNVTLTVTDADGTSTSTVFTGRTMSRNGGPSAQKVVPVSIG